MGYPEEIISGICSEECADSGPHMHNCMLGGIISSFAIAKVERRRAGWNC